MSYSRRAGGLVITPADGGEITSAVGASRLLALDRKKESFTKDHLVFYEVIFPLDGELTSDFGQRPIWSTFSLTGSGVFHYNEHPPPTLIGIVFTRPTPFIGRATEG